MTKTTLSGHPTHTPPLPNGISGSGHEVEGFDHRGPALIHVLLRNPIYI